MILYRSTSINGLPLAIIVFKVLKIIKNLFKIKFLVLQFKTKKKQKQTIKRNFVTKYLHIIPENINLNYFLQFEVAYR